MKVMLLAPSSSYSIGRLLENSLLKAGHEVAICNPENLIPRWKKRINSQLARFPYRFRRLWERDLLGKLNREYITHFRSEKPDLVMVYNDSMLIPESARMMRKKARLIFYLGDNPLYNWTKPLFLSLLREADFVFAPDSMWVQQLKMIGIQNIRFEILGWDNRYFFPMDPTPGEKQQYSSDLLFIGNIYGGSWGYKRALFLSRFSSLDLKIYGTRHWHRWFSDFPELRDRFVAVGKLMGSELVNTISNCCKLYPVDANPGLIHGLHARIFDCIGSGILPLVEYRKDLERVFENVDIPVINNYNEAHDAAVYFLKNQEKRRVLVERLRQVLSQDYLPEHAIKRILDDVSK